MGLEWVWDGSPGTVLISHEPPKLNVQAMSDEYFYIYGLCGKEIRFPFIQVYFTTRLCNVHVCTQAKMRPEYSITSHHELFPGNICHHQQ